MSVGEGTVREIATVGGRVSAQSGPYGGRTDESRTETAGQCERTPFDRGAQ